MIKHLDQVSLCNGMGRKWNDASYYGIRTKRYFKYLDTMLTKLFKEATKQNVEVNPALLEQILNITARQNNLTHTITKLVEVLDTNQRLMDMENLVHSIPAGTLAKAARESEDWKNRGWDFQR